jgi:hypothetical protein
MLVIEDHDGGKRSRNSCDMLKVDLICMTSRVTRCQVSGQATMAADLCDRSHTVAWGDSRDHLDSTLKSLRFYCILQPGS